jgi:hypothetical protein
VEARARQRFHRFSPRAWNAWVDGAARPLAQALSQAPGWTSEQREAVLESAVWLGAEAVGLGYLHVSEEATGWFHHAFGALLAERVPRREPRAALEDLAALWNLSESLERAAPWLRQLFLHFRFQLLAERSVADFVRHLDGVLGADGLLPLGDEPSAWTSAWLPASPLPGDALPGAAVFVAPRVVAVEHRGRSQASFFLLQPSPLPLGVGPAPTLPFPRSEAPPPERWPWLRAQRTGALYAECASQHAWVVSPELSQRVLFAWRAA